MPIFNKVIEKGKKVCGLKMSELISKYIDIDQIIYNKIIKGIDNLRCFNLFHFQFSKKKLNRKNLIGLVIIFLAPKGVMIYCHIY